MIYGEAEQEGFAQKVSCGAAARRRYFASVVEAWRWMAFALRGALRAARCCRRRQSCFRRCKSRCEGRRTENL